MIGTAVIGVGMYGEIHVRTYSKDNRVKLLKIWSRSKERAEKIANKYNCNYTNDLDEIVNDPEIKIVSVATPDFAHFEPAIKMIKAGKHVLIEKPLATTTKECEEILIESKRTNSKIMVNFHNRWYPPFKEAKRIVEQGSIGIPVSAFIRLSDIITVAIKMLSWANKSGPHWFLFPHTIDLIRWIFNDEIIKVYACGRKGVLKNFGIDTYDVVIAQATFKNGSMATFESSWIIPESWRNNLIEFKAEIYGEKGRIGINGDNEGIEVSSGNTYKTSLLYDFITEEEPIKYFIDCVINDKTPEPGVEDGLIVTKVIEGIVKSLQNGEAIQI